ncbi:hypothetical protein ACFL59_06140 [Planctomycetota bacterium]
MTRIGPSGTGLSDHDWGVSEEAEEPTVRPASTEPAEDAVAAARAAPSSLASRSLSFASPPAFGHDESPAAGKLNSVAGEGAAGLARTPGRDGAAGLPERVELGTYGLQFNKEYLFAVGAEGAQKGRLLFRPNTAVSGVEGGWQLVGGNGAPLGDEDIRLKAISVDGDFLMAVSEDDKVYRVTNAMADDPGEFEWKERYGWPFDMGTPLKVRKDLYSLTASSAQKHTTVYYEDPDGNKHDRFIGHVYALSRDDNYIHHNDPWTPSDWGYQFPMPLEGRFVPSSDGVPGMPVGMHASGSVVAVIGPGGVHTVEYDFDIGGGNPLTAYSPVEEEPVEGVGPNYFNFSTPQRMPPDGWAKQPDLPGRHTGNVQVSLQLSENGEIVPGGDSRMLRVLGLDDVDGRDVAGYWEKALTDEQWRFVPCSAFSVEDVRDHLIGDDPQTLIPSARRDYAETKTEKRHDGHWDSVSFKAELKGFGLHDNYWEPATVTCRLEGTGEEFELPLYTHIQMRTRAVEDPGEGGESKYMGAYLMIPEELRTADTPEAEKLRRYLKADEGDAYVRVFLEATGDRVEIFKPIVKLNVDFMAKLNDLLTRPLFVFEH